MPQESLGMRLREARKRLELTQDDLARRADISRQALSHYELGERIPTAEVLRRLARELGRSPDWLLSGEQASRMWDARQRFLERSPALQALMDLMNGWPEERVREALEMLGSEEAKAIARELLRFRRAET